MEAGLFLYLVISGCVILPAWCQRGIVGRVEDGYSYQMKVVEGFVEWLV